MTTSLSNQHDYLFKILLVGNSSVGKTCLLQQFVDNWFDESSIPTIGVDFKIRTLEISGKVAKLQIWDTAGQERFRTITTSYYRGAHGAVVVYDVTSRESFEDVKRWFHDIERYSSPSVRKILVGNKIDLNGSRQVSFEEGLDFASNLGIDFMETSAKTAYKVEDLFLNMAFQIKEEVVDPLMGSKEEKNLISVSKPMANNRFNCC
uniref:Ras-related protein Rab-18 n=1 Tax=Ditylum brightwellii TaxID=49249 RepID=A0A6U3RS86_9STRA|mmetsp:Transcript_32851/g.43794  ORF Transcript_32851/g.43794 Transcript_32851/m.43794 type:complete len:206 (-) Transcript_32851:171-788(-)